MLYIRLAEPGDQEEIAQIHAEAWLTAYKDILPPQDLARGSLEARRKLWAGLLAQPGHRHYIALEQGTPVGFFSLIQPTDPDLPPGALEVKAIYFSSRHWRKGYGTQCMSFILSHAKTQGSSCIILWVLEANTRARTFYQKAGMTPDGARKPVSPGSAVDEIRYRLTL